MAAPLRETGASRRAMILLLSAVGLVAAGWLGWAVLATGRAHTVATEQSAAMQAPQSGASTPTALESNRNAGTSDTVSLVPRVTPVAPAPLRKTTNPDIADRALDAFIARQYPGYRVSRRISFPGQWEDGRLSIDYVMQNVRRPQFGLLVSVSHMKPGDASRELDWPAFPVDGVLTDDEAFSADARTKFRFLTPQYQDAMIDAYLTKTPAADAFAYGAFVTVAAGNAVEFSVDAGPGALESAMTDGGDSYMWRVEVHADRGSTTPRIAITPN